MSYVGVKKLISGSFSCPYLKPVIGPGAKKKHDAVVELVKDWFKKKKGALCFTEQPLHDERGSIKGRADIICEDPERAVHIVEAKSTRVYEAKLQDLIQLMFYVYMYSQNKNVPIEHIHAYLTYKRGWWSAYIIELRGDIKKALAEIVPSIAEMQKHISKEAHGLKTGELYVISDLCRICASDSCPFQAS